MIPSAQVNNLPLHSRVCAICTEVMTLKVDHCGVAGFIRLHSCETTPEVEIGMCTHAVLQYYVGIMNV